MRGALVRLDAIEEDDLPTVAGWFRKSAVGMLGTGAATAFTSTDAMRQAVEAGPERYAMVRTHDGTRVGLVQWRRRKYAGSYTVGGIIGDSELWDSGCGGEASWLLVHHLFHDQNAHRVEFVTAAFNVRVIKMLVKSGMVIEGILRDYFFVDGEYHDAVVTSYLRDEYYSTDESGISGETFFGDTIPAEDKLEAQRVLGAYLRERWLEDIGEKYKER